MLPSPGVRKPFGVLIIFYPTQFSLWRSVVNFETDSYLMLQEPTAWMRPRAPLTYLWPVQGWYFSTKVSDSHHYKAETETNTDFWIIHHVNCLNYDISLAIIMVIKDNVYTIPLHFDLHPSSSRRLLSPWICVRKLCNNASLPPPAADNRIGEQPSSETF